MAACAALSLVACAGPPQGDASPAGTGDTTNRAPTVWSGVTRNVAEEYPTIQAGVDAAERGDLVLVDRGTYKETVTVITDGLTIRGVDPNDVVIDGELERFNGVVTWNGIAGFYHSFPIKVEKDEPIRAYIINMLEYEPLASFHLHAEMFAVYPAGMGTNPVFREDTIALAMGQRAMIELTLPNDGRYMFHPHQHWLADKGAMGWIAAV